MAKKKKSGILGTIKSKLKERKRKKRAKSENIKVIPKKPKKKRMPVAGKCSPGKILIKGKCVKFEP